MKLMLLLDSMSYTERRLKEPLSHDGGKLLQMLMNRLSIPREAWINSYCCEDKERLPSTKKERQIALSADAHRIREQIKLNEPCIVVGMGKLACEILTNASLVSQRAGTYWRTNFGIAWITYSPDAALYDPPLVVEIYGVLAKAAEMAKIKTKFNYRIPMFDWSEYERMH